MADKEWYALVTFTAETPDDDLEADQMADRLGDEIGTALTALVAEISYANVVDVDTYDAGRWMPRSGLAEL